MSSELSESSIPAEVETTEQAPAPTEVAVRPSRAEMESSVLDALRPLLRPRRKKRDGEEATETSAFDGPEAHEAIGPEHETGSFGETSQETSMTSRDEIDTFMSGDGLGDEIETFAAIGEDLERRSRQSAKMVRLLEQHRQQLHTAERQRDEAYDKLARVIPVVEDTARQLKEAMDLRRFDEDQNHMQRLFSLNSRALDELEKISISLFADFLWCKSAWEQYAKSLEDARALRSSLETSV